VDMPLTGVSGVECRSATTYNAVFSFDAPVTSGEITVTGGKATVGAITFSGNRMTAQLTGVTAAEVVTLHTQNINGDGQPHGDVPFGFLVADANASRVVDKPDKTLVEGQLNQPVTASNFRDDINLSGIVDRPDLQSVQTNRGNSIPQLGKRYLVSGSSSGRHSRMGISAGPIFQRRTTDSVGPLTFTR